MINPSMAIKGNGELPPLIRRAMFNKLILYAIIINNRENSILYAIIINNRENSKMINNKSTASLNALIILFQIGCQQLFPSWIFNINNYKPYI